MNPADHELARRAEANHAVFGLTDARDVGLTDEQCAYRLRTGIWVPIHEGAFRLAGSVLSPMGRLAAVCRVLDPNSAVSHRSAAFVHDLPGAQPTIVEVTGRRHHRSNHADLVVHESRALRDEDRTEVDRIRVTTVARTILDLGAVCPSVVVEMALDRALRRGQVRLGEMFELLDAVGKRGRPGVGVLRTTLAARDPRQAVPESVMETRLRRMLRGHGLPDPVPQYEIRDGQGVFVARVDFAYPEARVAIEYDSLEHHTGTAAHVRDSARRNRIEAEKWAVIVATVHDVRNRGFALARAIRGALRRDRDACRDGAHTFWR